MCVDSSALQQTDNGICKLSNNNPTIKELYEGCSHLGDHISYNAETDKLYICHDGGASGFAISHLPSGSYKSMLYYGDVTSILRPPTFLFSFYSGL